MRVAVLFVLACIAQSTVAEESVPVVLYKCTDADGHRVQYRSDTKTLWDMPQWTPGGKGPQLSLEAATKIAMDAGMRQVPNANGISFGNIKLLKNVFDYSGGRVVTWFWVFTVSPVINGDPGQPTMSIVRPPRDIVILLDGKVIDPTPMK